jgi:hypothetical protein
MSGPAFFQTEMGKRFYEGTLPELVKQLRRIGDGLDRLNRNLESQAGTTTNTPEGTGETPQDR